MSEQVALGANGTARTVDVEPRRILVQLASPADAAANATDGITVSDDIHANPTYRAAMAAVCARRAIETALARAE